MSGHDYPNPYGRKLHFSAAELPQPGWLVFMNDDAVKALRDSCTRDVALGMIGSQTSGYGKKPKELAEGVVEALALEHPPKICRDMFKIGEDRYEAKKVFKDMIENKVRTYLNSHLQIKIANKTANRLTSLESTTKDITGRLVVVEKKVGVRLRLGARMEKVEKKLKEQGEEKDLAAMLAEAGWESEEEEEEKGMVELYDARKGGKKDDKRM